MSIIIKFSVFFCVFFIVFGTFNDTFEATFKEILGLWFGSSTMYFSKNKHDVAESVFFNYVWDYSVHPY